MKKFNNKNRFSLDKTILNSNFNYCKNMKWFLIAPVVLIIVGIILLFTVGFNLGIDFTGGSVVKIYANSSGEIESSRAYDLDNSKDYNDLRNEIQEVLDKHGFKIKIFRTSTMDFKEGTFSVQDTACVEVQYQDTEGKDWQDIKLALLKHFGYAESFDDETAVLVSDPNITTATASSELLMNCFIAMLVAIALILIYVGFRFEFTSGLAAILALFHDLIVTTALVLICRIQINASFVAALVTILGYSINNTIIIFDRIRENRKSGMYVNKGNSRSAVAENNVAIANASVKETMTRSVLTTLTTLITIALVAIIGVNDIREFALPIIFGTGAGFYSSVFLTPGLWAIAYRPRKKKKTEGKKVNA